MDHVSNPDNVYRPVVPSIFEVLFRALLVSEEEGAPEIGLDHLLAALDRTTEQSSLLDVSTGPYMPIPHRNMNLSEEAKAAIKAACAVVPCDIGQLPIDSFRSALVAARRGRTK